MVFTGKVVLITGVTSGIGAQTAVHFSKLGATLALTGRNKEKLAETVKKCSPSKILKISADMNKDADVANIIDETIKVCGKLDVLVNNAGMLESGSIEETNVAQYDRVMNTNIRAVYHLTNLAVPHLIKTKGNIVNVSSVNGIRAFPGLVAYNLSKAALDQFTRCVALELASKQVRVNSVNPGVIITALHTRSGMLDAEYAQFLERTKVTHPLGRPGETKEVASAITFLASNDASFITGVTLSVDGGKHALCPR